MNIKTLTLELAIERHPEEVAKLQAEATIKLQRSKSKKKGKDISELTWRYDTCVAIPSYSAKDLFSGKMQQAQAAQNALPLEEKVADLCARTKTSLIAEMQGASVYAPIPNPPEVEENARTYFEGVQVELDRVAALTPEERNAEAQNLLAQLRKGKGFVEL